MGVVSLNDIQILFFQLLLPDQLSVVQVTTGGFVSSILPGPIFPVIVGGSGFTEIIYKCCF